MGKPWQFANVIVLNKISTILAIEARRVRATIEALNPGALVVTADYGQAPLEHILNTKRFDMDAASKSAGWLRELGGESTNGTPH